MSTGRHSRHLKSAQETDVLVRLAKILRRVVVPSGQTKSKGRQSYRRSGSQRQRHIRSESVSRGPWLVKQEIGLGRLGIIVCLLVGVLWIGWRIIAQTAALSLIESDPRGALDWETTAAALTLLAQQEVSKPEGNLDIARGWAERALRSDPLDSRALTLLGLIAERKGDEKSAEALIRIAARRTWRDREAHAWLLNRYFRRGDFSQAVPHADALMRAAGYTQLLELFPVLAAFTVEPKALQALTGLLATAPPWRSWFLSQLSARLANQSRLDQLYDALSETQTPPTKEELRPYLDRLIRDANFERAYDIWHRTLSSEQRASETYPFNRDFELPTDNLPFNWNLDTVPGAEIRIVTFNGETRALLVDFAGTSVDFASAKQLMVLPAGDYRFTGKVKTEELITSRGLWWRIFCAKDPSETVAHSELVSGTMPWTDFAVKFHVPEDCRAQWLQLELPARVDSERKIAGQAWYRDLRIVAKGGAPS